MINEFDKKLVIKEEFRDRLSPLSEEEFRALEVNVLQFGCLDPVKVWQSNGKYIVVDGHNRLAICRAHNLPYRLSTIAFADETEALDWIISHQLGRRNLTECQRDYYLGKRYNATQRRGRRTKEAIMGRTETLLAREHGTTVQHVRKSSVVAEAMDKLGDVIGPEFWRKIFKLTHLVKYNELVRWSQKSESVIKSIWRLLKLDKYRYAYIVSVVQREEQRDRAVYGANAAIREGNPKFNVIVIDPPWPYDRTAIPRMGPAFHYGTPMEMEQIKAIPIKEVAARDCVVLLWCPGTKLEEGLECLRAWGFKYRSQMVWDKGQVGGGYFNRNRHENVLIATCGRPGVPAEDKRPDSIFVGLRRDHSRKPDTFYEMVDTMYPEYHKADVFARQNREGWTTFGNEIDGVDICQSLKQYAQPDSTDQSKTSPEMYTGDSQLNSLMELYSIAQRQDITRSTASGSVAASADGKS